MLTNQESGEAFNAIAYRILDHYLGAPPTRLGERYAAVKARRDTAIAEAVQKAQTSRAAASTPVTAARALRGHLPRRWYGDITIARRAAARHALHADPVARRDLEHWQYDTFIARWRDRELRADAYVTFALDPDGSIDQAKMRAVSPETDFSFDFQDLRLVPVAGTP